MRVCHSQFWNLVLLFLCSRVLATSGEDKIESVLKACETAVKEFADKVANAHANRCALCEKEPSYHYNACQKSQLPNATCRSKEEGGLFHVPSCAEGWYCNARFDTTTSVVQIPHYHPENPFPPSVLESICLGNGMDDFLRFEYEKLRQQLYEITGVYEAPTFSFGSSTDGVTRTYPGRSLFSTCGTDHYDDARWSPWYAAGLSAAAAAPKTVVVIWDVTLLDPHQDHLEYARDVVRAFVETTLTDEDSIAVLLAFPDTPRPKVIQPPHCSHNEEEEDDMRIVDADPSQWSGLCPLAKAKHRIQRKLKASLSRHHVKGKEGHVDLMSAFNTAFELLKPENVAVGDVAIVLFTHEDRLEHLNVTEIRRRQGEIQAAMERKMAGEGEDADKVDFSRSVQLFGYLSGRDPTEMTPLAARTECELEGIWHVLNPKKSYRGIAEAIHLFQSAYTVSHRRKATKSDKAPLWTEPFVVVGGGGVLQTAVSLDVYNHKSISPSFFVGVVSIGLSLDFLYQATAKASNWDSRGGEYGMLKDVRETLRTRRSHSLHYYNIPRLTDCQLKALRLDSRRMMAQVMQDYDDPNAATALDSLAAIAKVSSSADEMIHLSEACQNSTCSSTSGSIIGLPHLEPPDMCSNGTLLESLVTVVNGKNAGVSEETWTNLTCCAAVRGTNDYEQLPIKEEGGPKCSPQTLQQLGDDNDEDDYGNDDYQDDNDDQLEDGRSNMAWHMLAGVALLLGIIALFIGCRIRSKKEQSARQLSSERCLLR